MRRATLLALLMTGLTVSALTQEISPYLFGQNHWLAQHMKGRLMCNSMIEGGSLPWEEYNCR